MQSPKCPVFVLTKRGLIPRCVRGHELASTSFLPSPTLVARADGASRFSRSGKGGIREDQLPCAFSRPLFGSRIVPLVETSNIVNWPADLSRHESLQR